MHKTTNKKRYETPSLIIAQAECMTLMAQSTVGGAGEPPKNEVGDGDDGNDYVKGMSLWDEGW